jgi:hypothetical protein
MADKGKTYVELNPDATQETIFTSDLPNYGRLSRVKKKTSSVAKEKPVARPKESAPKFSLDDFVPKSAPIEDDFKYRKFNAPDMPKEDITTKGQLGIGAAVGDLIRQGRLDEATKLMETAQKANQQMFRRDLTPEAYGADVISDIGGRIAGTRRGLEASTSGIFAGSQEEAADTQRKARQEMLQQLELGERVGRGSLADLLAARRQSTDEQRVATERSIGLGRLNLERQEALRLGAMAKEQIMKSKLDRELARRQNNVDEEVKINAIIESEKKNLIELYKQTTDDTVRKELEKMIIQTK